MLVLKLCCPLHLVIYNLLYTFRLACELTSPNFKILKIDMNFYLYLRPIIYYGSLKIKKYFDQKSIWHFLGNEFLHERFCSPTFQNHKVEYLRKTLIDDFKKIKDKLQVFKN